MREAIGELKDKMQLLASEKQRAEMEELHDKRLKANQKQFEKTMELMKDQAK